jgi:hypothetical protein
MEIIKANYFNFPGKAYMHDRYNQVHIMQYKLSYYVYHDFFRNRYR